MQKVLYSDINLDFFANPATGDVVKIYNADAIKRSFRNLIMTNYFDVPFSPTIGSSIRGSLFENFSPLGNEFLKSKIKEMLEEHEPRVLVGAITINQQEDSNRMQVSISYRIIDLNREDNITIFVGRTR